jgi:hypothetical protein
MTRTLHDARCKEVVARKPSGAIAWFIMASYTYYILDRPIISDGLYDYLAQYIKSNWDQLEHMHKYMIDLNSLESGSLHQYTEDEYPRMARGGAHALLRDLR